MLVTAIRMLSAAEVEPRDEVSLRIAFGDAASPNATASGTSRPAANRNLLHARV